MKRRKYNTCNEDIYQRVANELGIDTTLVRSVVEEGQSKFTADVIRSKTFEGVRWPYLGAFLAKLKSIQIYNHIQGLNENQRKQFFRDLKAGKIFSTKKGLRTKEFNHENTKKD